MIQNVRSAHSHGLQQAKEVNKQVLPNPNLHFVQHVDGAHSVKIKSEGGQFVREGVLRYRQQPYLANLGHTCLRNNQGCGLQQLLHHCCPYSIVVLVHMLPCLCYGFPSFQVVDALLRSPNPTVVLGPHLRDRVEGNKASRTGAVTHVSYPHHLDPRVGQLVWKAARKGRRIHLSG